MKNRKPSKCYVCDKPISFPKILKEARSIMFKGENIAVKKGQAVCLACYMRNSEHKLEN